MKNWFQEPRIPPQWYPGLTKCHVLLSPNKRHLKFSLGLWFEGYSSIYTWILFWGSRSFIEGSLNLSLCFLYYLALSNNISILKLASYFEVIKILQKIGFKVLDFHWESSEGNNIHIQTRWSCLLWNLINNMLPRTFGKVIAMCKYRSKIGLMA